MVEVRRAEAEASTLASSEKYLEELARLSRELVEAKTELGILRFQVPALEAAQVERDHLAQETAFLRAALAGAQANARWRGRRQMKKVVVE